MIASVAVDVPMPHLDRTFDYRVPADLADAVVVGGRVRVAFAGRLVNGIVMSLHEDASRATADIRAVPSSAVVVPPAQAALVRAVADRYAATFADVLRFALPARHARAESAALAAEMPPRPVGRALDGPLVQVRGMQAFLARSARGEALCANLEVPTQLDLPSAVASVAAALLLEQSVIVVAPDARDVDRLCAAFASMGIDAQVMRSADGPSVRQRIFTTVMRSERALVVGTRAAVFAPVSGRGVTIVMGDGNDGLVETQTPGWHAREVARQRTQTQGWSTLLMAHHRSIEVQALVEAGDVKPLQWSREQWRTLSAKSESVPERYDDADPLLHRLRIPPSVFRAMRETLRSGPVLLSVAHRGYVTTVRCAGCKEAARCSSCSGPIAVEAEGAPPRCRWCGTAGWACPWCGGTRVLFRTLGVERTREELGRAFPEIPIRVIDAEHPLDQMPTAPQLLLVTPGMEPVGRVPLAVILDVEQVLGRHDLAASTEAVRRWLDVAACVRADGRILLVGSQTMPAVQAIVRADPVGFAERELHDRRNAGLPPAVHAAVIEAPLGNQAAIEMHAGAPDARVLGPATLADGQRWLLLHPQLDVLCGAVRTVVVKRSASKSLAGVRVRIDPLELAT